MQGRKIEFDELELYHLYWELGLNGMEIAKILGCGWHTVYKAIKRFEMPLRTRGIAAQIVCENTGKNKYQRNPSWKGGRVKHTDGYILIKLMPDDPYISMVGKYGYCMEHRYIMAKSLGRILSKTEPVHHINGIKDDNRVENLRLVSTQDHSTYNQVCYNCPLRKEIRLLQWQIKELQKQVEVTE